MDIKNNHQELIDVKKVIEECTDKSFHQTLTKVNGSVERIGIVEGEYHWHKHDDDDEFFFVLSGQLFIELEDKTLVLTPNEGATISKGVMHKTRVPQKTIMLMLETDTIDLIRNSKIIAKSKKAAHNKQDFVGRAIPTIKYHVVRKQCSNNYTLSDLK